MDSIEYTYTYGLDEAEIDDYLRSTPTGVLALADGSDAYAIPLVHHYDGDGLYLRLGSTPDSEKRRFVDRADRVCYVVYGTKRTNGPEEFESWSVLVTGRLTELTGPDRERFDTAEINKNFPPIRVFDEAIEEIDVRVFELEIDTIAGRSTVPS